MFKFIPETSIVLKEAWSVRFIIAAVAVVWLEGPLTTIIEHVTGYSLRSQIIAQAVTSTLMVLALYARVIVQDHMQERIAARRADGE